VFGFSKTIHCGPLLAPALHKGNAMNREPTDWEVVGMALIAAPTLYVLLWLGMAIF
jgi:hypothetical protein